MNVAPLNWWELPDLIGATITSVDRDEGLATLVRTDGSEVVIDLWTDREEQ